MTPNYGSLELTVSSPQLLPEEFLDLDTAKDFLRVDSPESDSLIMGFIVAARVAAEYWQGIDLAVKQYDLRLNYFPSFYDPGYDASRFLCDYNSVQLRTPLRCVDLVQYQESDGVFNTLSENTDYIVDMPRGSVTPTFGNSWPGYTAWPSSSVLIRFRSGYGPLHPFWANKGAMIMVGMQMLITQWYDKRLPFGDNVRELPHGITDLLSWGARERVR